MSWIRLLGWCSSYNLREAHIDHESYASDGYGICHNGSVFYLDKLNDLNEAIHEFNTTPDRYTLYPYGITGFWVWTPDLKDNVGNNPRWIYSDTKPIDISFYTPTDPEDYKKLELFGIF